MFARERLAEAIALNRRAHGRAPKYKTFVDGRSEARLESVRPKGGSIVFEFELVVDVLQWIHATLRERSPVLSGRYRDSHTLFADGREADVGSIPAAAEYTFMNTVPYARKIEVGRTRAGRSFVIQVPNRIYERTATDARARFGNVARISFDFRTLPGSDTRFPTIVVST
jgi:hypothetical protein